MNKKQLTLLKELIAEIQDDLDSFEKEQKNLVKKGNFRDAAENALYKRIKDYYMWRLTLVLNGQTIKENSEEILKAP